jgi:hypothetical protein
MDPVEDNIPVAAVARAAAAPGPKIFQLSPFPGNIYETDRLGTVCFIFKLLNNSI